MVNPRNPIIRVIAFIPVLPRYFTPKGATRKIDHDKTAVSIIAKIVIKYCCHSVMVEARPNTTAMLPGPDSIGIAIGLKEISSFEIASSSSSAVSFFPPSFGLRSEYEALIIMSPPAILIPSRLIPKKLIM